MKDGNPTSPTTAWTVKSKDGRLSPYHVSSSLPELERRLVGTSYDADTLYSGPTSYREMFYKELSDCLNAYGYTPVRVSLTEIVDE